MFMEKYINSNIFREYDIRGVVEKDFDDSLVFDIGRAYGTYLVNNNFDNISVSGDIRFTTPDLKKNLIKGLVSTGVSVYDLGILPTPANYYSLFKTDVENSIQITGSHNPSEYNGFKISFNKKPFYGSSIQKLKKIIINKEFVRSKVPGLIIERNILNDYNSYLVNSFNFENTIKVSIDCGNASACLTAPEIFKRLGIDVNLLFCDVDSSFPNHHPDPTVDSNLKELVKQVLKTKSNLGVAFDGDADRVVVVDNLGRIIRSDILISLFVNFIIKDKDYVVYDVKCSKALKEIILNCGGIPIECKTGHSIIKNKIIEYNSKIGGEMSGHIFFSDKFFGFDDAVYVSLRLIEILSNNNIKLSELVDAIPKYSSTPEIRIDCKDDKEKEIIVSKITNYFKAEYTYSAIDGIKVMFEKGWALIRCSNTQPVIVLRFEADTNVFLEQYIQIVKTKFKEICNFELKF